ncbi:hypothetical protein KKF84_17240, partial [Myxococcota bacterium]|nr:hypothetical protein [Myxococcota bacterium]
ALSRDLPMMMTAHVVFEKVDPHRPATLSPTVLGLSRSMGFKGIMVSDDLEMGALSGYDPATLGVGIINAGAHMGLVCSKLNLFEEIREAMIREISMSSSFAENITAALGLVESWRAGLPDPTRDFPVENYSRLRDNHLVYLEGITEVTNGHI